MILGYWDPKTKEVRIVDTSLTPAIAILSRIEEDNVIKARQRPDGRLRAQLLVSFEGCPETANPIRLAQLESKLKEALSNYPVVHEYVASQGEAPSADQIGSNALDISANFARKK